MALLTDDQDIQIQYLRMMFGGNGDYYIQIIKDEGDFMSQSCVRISTSGGNAPSEVKIAAANLFRALEKAGLNGYP